MVWKAANSLQIHLFLVRVDISANWNWESKLIPLEDKPTSGPTSFVRLVTVLELLVAAELVISLRHSSCTSFHLSVSLFGILHGTRVLLSGTF